MNSRFCLAVVYAATHRIDLAVAAAIFQNGPVKKCGFYAHRVAAARDGAKGGDSGYPDRGRTRRSRRCGRRQLNTGS
jgi:hypothetical protein